MKHKPLMLLAGMMSGALLFAQPQTAHASDWGCQVLLCLSDPRGPTTESECRPPIEKLWDHLKKGRSFPSCAMAGDSGSGQGSFARMVSDPFDPCPAGLRPVGGWVGQAASSNRNDVRRAGYAFSFMYNRYNEDGQPELGPRACVGKVLGGYTAYGMGDEDGKQVTVYDEVVWQQPQNPRAIDVYIDGSFYQRVRW